MIVGVSSVSKLAFEKEMKKKFTCVQCKKFGSCKYITSAEVKTNCVKDFKPIKDFSKEFKEVIERHRVRY